MSGPASYRKQTISLTAAQESLTMALEAAQMRTWNLDLGRLCGRAIRHQAAPRRLGLVLSEWSRECR